MFKRIHLWYLRRRARYLLRKLYRHEDRMGDLPIYQYERVNAYITVLDRFDTVWFKLQKLDPRTPANPYQYKNTITP